MGRDWYWGSGAKISSSTSRRAAERDSAGQTTPSGCISTVFHLFDFHHFQFPLNHQAGTSSCSRRLKPDSFLSPDPITGHKGTEAPRNSLESEQEGSTSASASLTSTSKLEEEILNIPVGIQIKTSGDTRSKVGAPNNDTSSEISGSPGTKTPTLVARLMGLDLLPENRSPSFSSAPNFHAKSHLNHHHIQSRKPLQSKITGHRNSLDGEIRGTRSLPETPRISSERRSDVDHHHRLSLQINKENMSAGEELVISRLSSLKKELKHEDENRSPGHYTRQIVKQVKESVSRKVGMDITNTVRNREQAREVLVSQFKYKKITRALTKVGDDSSPGKHSTPSCSPRLRFLESKSKPVINSSTKDHNSQASKPSFSSSLTELYIQPQPISVLSKPKLQPVEEEQRELQIEQQLPRATSKCNKGSSEKFSSRLKKPQKTLDIIRNKQEEPFIRPSTANRVKIPDKKCRKTPLSNNLLNNITVPTLLPVKKDPSPPATKIPQKQVLDAQRPKRGSQLSSCSSQTYNKQEEAHLHVSRDNTNNGDRCNDAPATTVTTTGDEEEYNEYISRILRRTGLDKDTPVSFTSWFSPSHPLDPSIFYYLEHFTTCSSIFNNNNKTKSSPLRHRCNRKLLFHLVDEILVEILKPHFNLRPWVVTFGHNFISHMDGSGLIDTLCSKISSFPQADCLVLEDIDALIDRDLPEMKLQSVEAYEEEGEGIVTEIEKDILQSLVHETAVDFVARV